MTSEAVRNKPARITASNSQEENLSWCIHPLKENRARSAALLVVLVLIFSGVYVFFGGLFWAVLGVVLLTSSMRGYFFATRYRLTASEVEVERLGSRFRVPWSHYRSYHVDKHGVLLSPFSGPHRLENFRGNFLLVRSDLRRRVLEFVKEHIDEVE